MAHADSMETPTENKKSPNLPNEIIVWEILSRLPVKSLLRFRSVSKSWRASISDPNLVLSDDQRRLRVVLDYGYTFGKLDVIYQDSSVGKLHVRPDQIGLLAANVLCSYKGLLLVSFIDEIFLCNPSTRIYKKVLTHYRQVDGAKVGPSCYGCGGYCGLCYDSCNNDYKVVFVTEESSNGPLIVVVASLATKIWRRIRIPYHMNYCMNCYGNDGVLINERIHLLVRERKEMRFSDVVVYFDPAKDDFFEVGIPEPLWQNVKGSLGMGILDGCLTLTRPRADNEDSIRRVDSLDVWVMKEYGVEDSWTILFSFRISSSSACGGYYVPLFVTSDGDVLVREGSRGIVAYNRENGTQRDVLVRDRRVLAKAIVYTESLMSPM